MKYQEHKKKWRACRRCELWKERGKVVLARGRVPCDVLMVGEAPGQSEDVLGRPFVGPAGRLLEEIMEEGLDWRLTWAMTNMIACFPKKKVREEKDYRPPEGAIEACRERLEEFMGMCRMRAVVTVGETARMWAPRIKGVKYVEMVHPAAILRADVSQRNVAIKRCIAALQTICYDR